MIQNIPSDAVDVAADRHPEIAILAACAVCGGVAYCYKGCKPHREFDPAPREHARRRLETIARRELLS